MIPAPPTAPRRYFDNAATSFPKPESVARAMLDYATGLGASPGRGAYAESRASAEILTRCRRAIGDLINLPSPDHVVFTLNTSDALNLAIRGIAEPIARAGHRPHLVTTAMDHNSVLRPFNALAKRIGAEVTFVEVEQDTGIVDPADIAVAMRTNTSLVAVVHASNATGTIQPVAEIGRLCRERDVPFLVDAAQSLGHIPVDMDALRVDLLAAPGHKGLLGPLGTGFLAIRPGIERRLDTVREGGTGSVSELDTHPDALPDKYEAGSHNTIGIAGLLAGVEHILDRGIETIAAHERALIERFLARIGAPADLPPGLRLLGPQTADHRVGVLSVTLDAVTPDELASTLEHEFGVLTRAGIHCAPHAHRTMRTDQASVSSPDHAGATRFSLGPFLAPHDVDHAAASLRTIAERTATATHA